MRRSFSERDCGGVVIVSLGSTRYGKRWVVMMVMVVVGLMLYG